MLTETVQELFQKAGIRIDGTDAWDIRVHSARFYTRAVREKNLGLGESYMDGWWDCGQVDEMICRLLKSDLQDRIRGSLRYQLRLLPAVLFNLQSRARARRIAKHHYNFGNDLFFSFLDPFNQYSCAYFQDVSDLNKAQEKKLELICGKLDLRPSDHLLDIGCGWGGLARYAAERVGCAVTGVNISSEQLEYARNFCRELPVTFLDCDYRAIAGRFDKIVSVGMFEHVGQKNYRIFMETIRRCLKEDGIFLLHTIGRNTSGAGCDPWITKYIFPNGMLPSVAQIAKAAEGLFVIEDWHNIGPHYDRTLMAWNRNFQAAWPRLKGRYDERFKRMWEYYLLSCAGAFRARSNQVWQVVMTPQGDDAPQPGYRHRAVH